MEGKKVLFVEDDAVIGPMYKTKLEQEKYTVFLATDGAQGLEMAKQEKPDIIMLDVILPQIDGFGVLEKLRETDKKTPIVLLTNLGTDEDKAKGEKLGATDYLVKASLTPTQVSEAIKKNLK